MDTVPFHQPLACVTVVQLPRKTPCAGLGERILEPFEMLVRMLTLSLCISFVTCRINDTHTQ